MDLYVNKLNDKRSIKICKIVDAYKKLEKKPVIVYI